MVTGGRGRIVLVGGGDPFLMSEPVGEDGPSYPARADIVTLAQQTAAALRQQGRKRVALGFDDSLFAAPAFNPAWPASYAAEDVVSPITALWVDQGREPDSFRRVEDPSLYAAQVFAAALVAAGIEVVGDPTYGIAGGSGREIAAVTSAPVREIVDRVLEVSDNEAAEVLAHHIGLATRGTGSFTDGVLGTMRTLRGLGVATAGIEIYDGSGLSRDNRITPEALLAVLRAAATGGPTLHAVIDAPARRRVHRLAQRPLRRDVPRGPRPGARQDRHPHRGEQPRRCGGRPAGPPAAVRADGGPGPQAGRGRRRGRPRRGRRRPRRVPLRAPVAETSQTIVIQSTMLRA